MNDQSFHEIQLSGKQLVVLFMSAVVLAVVIFLLGVSVGRGVRGSVASASTADVGVPTDTTASATPTPAGTKITPADLDYREKLQGQGAAGSAAAGAAAAAVSSATKPADTPATTPTPAADAPSTKPPDKPNLLSMTDDPTKAKPPPAPTSTPKPPATKPAAPPPAAKPAPAAATKPNDDGWFLQLGAFGTKGAADALIRELKGKGYTASAVNSATLVKVRMGPYADRADADKMASRLMKDGYKPLVTR
jgi:cell division septation protein DedD